MRFEIKNQLVTFYLDNPKRTAEAIATQSFAGSGLSEQLIIPLVESLVKKFRGQSLGYQRSVTSMFLRPLFAYFKATGTSWPISSADWQLTVYGFFQFYLTDTGWSQARTGFRMKAWQSRVGGLLEFLMEEEIIPNAVVIPKINHRKLSSLAKDQPLLGQPRSRTFNVATQPQKLLVDISFGMTDADYLDVVEKKCRHLVSVIRDTCMEHWDGLMRDGAIGRKLAEQVTDAEIEEAIMIGKYGTPRSKGGAPTRYASPAHPQGHT
jgi:hypothetical protein